MIFDLFDEEIKFRATHFILFAESMMCREHLFAEGSNIARFKCGTTIE